MGVRCLGDNLQKDGSSVNRLLRCTSVGVLYLNTPRSLKFIQPKHRLQCTVCKAKNLEMSWRKGIATHSKFRNVYGEPYRKDKCYENVRFTKNAWDGTYCAVNPKFLAVVLDTSRAGGAFLVIPLEKVRKTNIFCEKIHALTFYY